MRLWSMALTPLTVEGLARKWCPRCGGGVPYNACECDRLKAAIKEALEEVEKAVQSIYIREHNAVPDDKHDGQEVAREIIAALQAALRGTG